MSETTAEKQDVQETVEETVSTTVYNGVITVKFKITGDDMDVKEAEEIFTKLMAGNNIGEHFFLRFPPGIGDLNINISLKKDSPIITLDKSDVIVTP